MTDYALSSQSQKQTPTGDRECVLGYLTEMFPGTVITNYKNWIISITAPPPIVQKQKAKKPDVKPGQEYLDLRKSKW